MTGKPVLAASASENVLFPDPANPVTTTRRSSANGASLIATSFPQVPPGRIRDATQPPYWGTNEESSTALSPSPPKEGRSDSADRSIRRADLLQLLRSPRMEGSRRCRSGSPRCRWFQSQSRWQRTMPCRSTR
jgi:hypothetical protein